MSTLHWTSPTTRTLLGVLGHARVAMSCLFLPFCSRCGLVVWISLLTSPNSSAKIHGGDLRSVKNDFCVYFFFGASFSSFQFILSTLSSDTRDNPDYIGRAAAPTRCRGRGGRCSLPTRAKLLSAPEISLHFDDPPTESFNNLPHSQPRHGLVSLVDVFTCFLAINRMFSCPLDCLSLLIRLHSRFIHSNLVPIWLKSDQIEQISSHWDVISNFVRDLPAPRSSLTWGHSLMCFWRGSVSAANPLLLKPSEICPRLVTFWLSYIHRRYYRPQDHSQRVNYIILTCWIEGWCPFIVNPPYSGDSPGIQFAVGARGPYFLSKSDLYAPSYEQNTA